MSHCDTCQCDDPSALTTFNIRCRRLLSASPIDLPNWLRDRLVDHPRWQFGFREFMPSSSSTQVAGVFLCGVNEIPHPAANARKRFFGVVIPRPKSTYQSAATEPKPFEYSPGDMFDIYGSPYFEDLIELGRYNDTQLLEWLLSVRDSLLEFVLSACAEPKGDLVP